MAKRASELEHDYLTTMNEATAKLMVKVRELEEKAKREKEATDSEINGLRRQMEELVKKSEESEKLTSGLIKKVAKIKGVSKAEDDNDGVKGWKEQLQIIGAAAVGVLIVAAIAACYDENLFSLRF